MKDPKPDGVLLHGGREGEGALSQPGLGIGGWVEYKGGWWRVVWHTGESLFSCGAHNTASLCTHVHIVCRGGEVGCVWLYIVCSYIILYNSMSIYENILA